MEERRQYEKGGGREEEWEDMERRNEGRAGKIDKECGTKKRWKEGKSGIGGKGRIRGGNRKKE